MEKKQIIETIENEFGYEVNDEFWDFVLGQIDDEEIFRKQNYNEKEVKVIIDSANKCRPKPAGPSQKHQIPKQIALVSKPLQNDPGWQANNNLMLQILNPAIKTWRSVVLKRKPFRTWPEAQNWLAKKDSIGPNKNNLITKESSTTKAINRTAEYLNEICGWSKQNSIEYLLCDVRPKPQPVLGKIKIARRLGNPGRIYLEIDPRVKPDDIRKFYREITRDLKKHWKVPLSRKPVSNIGLALVNLYCEAPDLSWRERFKLWEKKYPEWKNHWQNAKTMADSYSQISKRLLPGLSYSSLVEEEIKRELKSFQKNR